MFWRLHRKFLQLLVALSLALPAGAATNVAQLTTAHASGVCYWSGQIWDTVSGSPAWSVSYASTVRYRIGYDCNLNPYELNVNYFYDTLTFSNSYGYHVSTAAVVCGYSDQYHQCLDGQWSNYSWSGGCSGNCTVVRYGYPNTYQFYDSSASFWEHWAGCDYAGYGWCETQHYFRTHSEYLIYGG